MENKNNTFNQGMNYYPESYSTTQSTDNKSASQTPNQNSNFNLGNGLNMQSLLPLLMGGKMNNDDMMSSLFKNNPSFSQLSALLPAMKKTKKETTPSSSKIKSDYIKVSSYYDDK